MVACQVREHSRRKRHPIHASQRQRVRRHFHRARAAALVDHLAKQRLDVRCLRRRARRFVDDVADAVGHRAEQAAPDAGRLENRRDEIRRRGLAVGAGDPDHLHLADSDRGRTRRRSRRARVGRLRPSPTAHGRLPARAARRRSRRRRAQWPDGRTPCRRRAGREAPRTPVRPSPSRESYDTPVTAPTAASARSPSSARMRPRPRRTPCSSDQVMGVPPAPGPGAIVEARDGRWWRGRAASPPPATATRRCRRRRRARSARA